MRPRREIGVKLRDSCVPVLSHSCRAINVGRSDKVSGFFAHKTRAAAHVRAGSAPWEKISSCPNANAKIVVRMGAFGKFRPPSTVDFREGKLSAWE